MRTRNRVKGSNEIFELAAAAFLLLGPVIINTSGESWGLYALFAVVSLCLGMRLISNGRLYLSFVSVLALAAGLYALIALFWAESTVGHLRLIYIILTAAETMLLAADYFTLEKEKGLAGRLFSMIIFSADVCAIWNVICWAVKRHFSLAEPFGEGLGGSGLLGIYMFVGLWCVSVLAFRDKRRRVFSAVSAVLLAFVLIMSRSALTLFFGASFAAVYLFRKNKRAESIIFAVAALAAGVYVIFSGAELDLVPFLDALRSAFTYPAGLGGGGFLARQTLLQSVWYEPVSELAGGASLASSLGIFGIAVILAFVICQLWLTVRCRSWFSAFTALLAIYSFFVPMGHSLAALMLLMCVAVYGEWRLGMTRNIKISRASAIVVCCALAGTAALGCVLGVGAGLCASGDRIAAKDGRAAVERYSAAAAIDPFDDESCFRAAEILRGLYEDGGEKEDAVNAEYYIGLAIERDPEAPRLRAGYARLLASTGDYASAARESERAIELAPKNDDYRVMLGENLYGLITTLEKGSVEAGQCYRRILDCAEGINDLDRKKIVNDYADKAQPFTRIDFYNGEADSASDDGESEE